MRSYDLIVIGGGSAGYAAARTAADLGKSVAIVEGGKQLGGLCILRGCMPSKTLLHVTDVIHRAKHAKTFGVEIPEVRVDAKALQLWKRKVIAEFALFRASELQSSRYDLYRSNARFLDAHQLGLDDGATLQGKKFLIATGSRARVPDVPGLKETPFWTSDDVMDLDFVPESVIVLGGGAVACELAQFLQRIGAKVTVIQRSERLLKGRLCSGCAVIRDAFLDDGIEVETGTKIESIAATSNGVRVIYRQAGKTRSKHAAYLFNALGREPNTSHLDLAAAGVVVTEGGSIEVNRWQQTKARHIYAAGDVCGPHELVHLAIAQGELAARHAFGSKGLKPIDARLLLTVVFTDPPMATLGLQEHQLMEQGIPYLSASASFADLGKAITMNETRGFAKLFADPTNGRILGAEMVGVQADSLIHCLTGPLAMNATVHDLLKAPWYHPTLAEIFVDLLEELAARTAKR